MTAPPQRNWGGTSRNLCSNWADSGDGGRGAQLFQLSFGDGGGGGGCLEFFCEVVDGGGGGGQEKGRKIKEEGGRDDADTDRDIIDREIIYCPINSTIKWSFLHRRMERWKKTEGH